MRGRRNEISQDAKHLELSCYRPLEYDFDVNAPESISMNTFHCFHRVIFASFRFATSVCVRVFTLDVPVWLPSFSSLASALLVRVQEKCEFIFA